ncbi:MAG: FecR domain-containing protein [Proteobacteria bacterium]|nr:FecR domain-containing protein [Pseudomonadota bacterium]
MTARRLRSPCWLLAALPFAAAAASAPPPDRGEAVHEYVVQRGDTLIGLGRRFLIDPAAWGELARSNQMRDPRRMAVGRTLRIPLRLMRTEPAPATVVSASGAAQSGGAELVNGQQVAEGAAVSTGADGQVTLRLVDGTLLRLRPAGRVQIEESRRVPGTEGVRSGVRLEQGRVEVQAKPAGGGQPGFRIGTPQGVLAVRGTEFRVNADAATTRGEVLEGTVAASGSPTAAEQRVGAGRGTLIDAAGQVTPPVALLAAPDLAGLPALHERPLVRLALAPLPGAVAYRAQVARDERFDVLLADVQSASPELRIAGLEDGRYALRVRAVDKLGLEGLDARGTLQLKARPEPPLPRAPAPRAEIRGDKADFAWAANSQAATYRLQIARADAAPRAFDAPLHDLRDLTQLDHVLERLAPGAYVWRLASIKADGDQGPYTDPLTFEMKPLPPQPAPPGPPTVSDGSVRLFWQGLAGQRFDFEVATDEAFTRFVAQLALDTTEIDLPLKGATGRFYVRLRAKDADGYVGPWSSTQHFDVPNCVRDAQRGCVQLQGGLLLLQ